MGWVVFGEAEAEEDEWEREGATVALRPPELDRVVSAVPLPELSVSTAPSSTSSIPSTSDVSPSLLPSLSSRS